MNLNVLGFYIILRDVYIKAGAMANDHSYPAIFIFGKSPLIPLAMLKSSSFDPLIFVILHVVQLDDEKMVSFREG